MAQYELNLKDYWFIVRKKKFLIMVTTFLVGIFSFVFSNYNKPVLLYKAATQVRVERNTTFSGLMLEVIRWTSWNDMETNARVVKSFSLIKDVAQKLGYINPDMRPGDILNDEKAIKEISRIQANTSATQISKTNILEISVTSEDPHEAQLLANTITETFREENIRLNNKNVIEAKVLIEDLLTKQNYQLTEAEENLKRFRRSESVFGLNKNTNYVKDEYLATKKDLEKIRKQKKAVEGIYEQLKGQDLSAYEAFNTVFITPILDKFGKPLRELITEKEFLLLDYTEDHPAVIKVQRQISGLRSEVLQFLRSKVKNLENEEKLTQSVLSRSKDRARSVLDYEMRFKKLVRDINLNENMVSFLKEKYQEALIRESSPIEEIYIVKPALLPKEPLNPHHTAKPTMIGVIIGLIIGMVAAFLAESLDPTIGTIEQVESYLGIRSLGIIHYATEESIFKYMKKHDIHVENERMMKHILYLITFYAPKFLASEMYRAIRTTLQFVAKEKKAKSLLITSAADREGKTAVSTNLAFSLAQIGKKTLLIDADFRRPRIYKVFGIDREPGLADVLLGNCEVTEAIRDATDIMMGDLNIKTLLSSPGLDNLHIMTSGMQVRESVEVLQSSRMDSLMEHLKKLYDYIIIDTTPITPVGDAVVLGTKVDGTILVYRVGRVSQAILKRAKLQMDMMKVKILGIIFNGLQQDALKEMNYTSAYKVYKYYHADSKDNAL